MHSINPPLSSDCPIGLTCGRGGACLHEPDVGLKGDGELCVENKDCASSQCFQNKICCNAVCDGACDSCDFGHCIKANCTVIATTTTTATLAERTVISNTARHFFKNKLFLSSDLYIKEFYCSTTTWYCQWYQDNNYCCRGCGQCVWRSASVGIDHRHV